MLLLIVLAWRWLCWVLFYWGCLMNKKLLDHAVVFFIAAAGFSLLSIAFSILAFAVSMLK
ncbi:gp03 [Escherichia phage Tls]|uniref:Uncharacterized protein n=1 Tax=Escherichia phage Tls TaxID=2892339 RepID=A5PIW0_9CAUD|nr:gp03 [Escherichia phage Tls]AAR09233.1 hypothetical protein GJGTLS_03 [Escherichia phage Tls]